MLAKGSETHHLPVRLPPRPFLCPPHSAVEALGPVLKSTRPVCSLTLPVGVPAGMPQPPVQELGEPGRRAWGARGACPQATPATGGRPSSAGLGPALAPTTGRLHLALAQPCGLMCPVAPGQPGLEPSSPVSSLSSIHPCAGRPAPEAAHWTTDTGTHPPHGHL